jgi:hypothetical protein
MDFGLLGVQKFHFWALPQVELAESIMAKVDEEQGSSLHREVNSTLTPTLRGAPLWGSQREREDG